MFPVFQPEGCTTQRVGGTQTGGWVQNCGGVQNQGPRNVERRRVQFFQYGSVLCDCTPSHSLPQCLFLISGDRPHTVLSSRIQRLYMVGCASVHIGCVLHQFGCRLWEALAWRWESQGAEPVSKATREEKQRKVGHMATSRKTRVCAEFGSLSTFPEGHRHPKVDSRDFMICWS